MEVDDTPIIEASIIEEVVETASCTVEDEVDEVEDEVGDGKDDVSVSVEGDVKLIHEDFELLEGDDAGSIESVMVLDTTSAEADEYVALVVTASGVDPLAITSAICDDGANVVEKDMTGFGEDTVLPDESS
ncbi:hypothetical protein HBI56_236980 [Parastagonospora nodorum]|nr:hypothetical protein HBI10_211540 [Parastagonospora nodorum]KAH4029661.1 hypothetical protein HBI13_030850 [Parastagonospora nodorum]KAH4076072.1 hypothetical protein HBH50_000240 [Parastagonospora nodorum]KAH4081899.1 hypothetical protein HBH48_194790 [Parastagonospora nodorum]KAH4092740.1 hypothetical protein HBH46_182450 [Parastagonospora nodorum]